MNIRSWVTFLAVAAALGLAVPARAADQIQQRDQKQLRDGSCNRTGLQTGSQLRQRKQDRRKDGSCKRTALGDQLRDRIQRRDGSCKTP